MSPRESDPVEANVEFASVPTIAILLLLGLTLRFIIAYVLLPGSGFPNDLSSFQGWSAQLVSHTPLGFYDTEGMIDYPPVYLLMLWVQGLLFAPFGGIGEFVKLMPMLADMALAGVVYYMAQDLGASRRRAMFAAVVIVLNPITWFNSAVWGQVDAVGSTFMLLALWALLRDKRELACVLAVVATLTKIQLGVLALLVGLVILRRSLLPRDGRTDPARVLVCVATALGTAALICLPFSGLHPQALVDHFKAVLDLVTLQFGGDPSGFIRQQATIAGLLTLAAGLVAAPGAAAAVWRSGLIQDSTTRAVAAGAAAIASVVAFGLMVFDDIAIHVGGSFGEYPYLTLNAYNPWSLVGGDADSGMTPMVQGLGWIHDAAGKDDSGPYAGFLVGPFRGDAFMYLVAVAVLLIGLAVLAWLIAGARSSRAEGVLEVAPADGSAAPAPDALAAPASTSILGSWAASWRLWLTDELRALAVACLVGAGVLALLLLSGPFKGIPASLFSDALLLATILVVAVWAAWRDDRLSIVVALAILTIAFFVVPTRVHERYLFPFFAVGALLLAVSWRWTAAYAVLALVNFGNLLAVIVLYRGIPDADGGFARQLLDWGGFFTSARIPDEFDSPLTPAGAIWPIAVSALVTGLGLVWALLQMRHRAVASLASEAESAGRVDYEPASSRDPDESYEPVPAAGSVAAAVAAVSTVAMSASGRPQGRPWSPGDAPEPALNPGSGEEEWDEDDVYTDERPEFVPAWVMSIWHRLFLRSRMPDRSPSLTGEPRGRFDKMDLWLVAVLIVTVLTLRVWRLDEPRQMYFDEVYHARTGTEFLQEWRYGIPHDIYEWTHPHFAKYMIAGSLTVFADDKVTATGSLGVTVKDAVVQPRSIPASEANANGTAAPEPNDARAKTGARIGDRVLIATGDEVRSYDLETRTLEATFKVPGATTLSLDGEAGNLYVGTSDGHVWRISTYSLDYVRLGTATAPAQPVELPVTIDFPIARIYAGAPPVILVVDTSGNIVSLDGTGKVLGKGFVEGASDFVSMGTGSASLVLKPNPTATDVPTAEPTEPSVPSTDPSSGPTAEPTEPIDQPTEEPTSSDMLSEIEAIASAAKLDPLVVEAAIPAADPAAAQAVDLNLTPQQIAAVQALVDDGKLPDFDIQRGNEQVAVAFKGGLGILNARFVTMTYTVPEWAYGPATSIALNPDSDQYSFVTAGSSLVLVRIDDSGAGSITLSGDQPLRQMPGPVTKVVYDAATKVTQVLGRTPDGSGWTVYAVETNGNAVFLDARLPFEPVAIGVDSTPDLPSTDRQALLAFASDGSMASVDVGQFAFGWRMTGVLFGTLMAVCLYLLTRLLFRRRSVGLLVALFSCIDGMLFAQSRIAMNDTYVGGLLLLGYLLFALLWLGDRTSRKAWLAFWLGMPVLGVIMGVALFSKWVALYALASMGMLILLRSALGRLIAILGLAAGTGTLGWMAIREMHTVPGTGDVGTWALLMAGAAGAVVVGMLAASWRARTSPDKVLFVVIGFLVAIPLALVAMTFYPAPDQNGSPNYTFFMLLLAATCIAAAANAYHPVAWTREEFWFAVLVPGLLGVGLNVLTFVAHHPLAFTFARHLPVIGNLSLTVPVGVLGVAASLGFAAAFFVAGRWGFGPLALPPGPNDPSAYAEPPSPAPTGWLRLGSGFGLPALWTAACLLVLPFVVYVLMYLPWSMPWQQEVPETVAANGQIVGTGPLPILMCWHTDAEGQCTDAFPSGHTGQTLMSLTESMYNYHNDLRATHAASSPWWAWPMDLKPVWFESITYGQDTGSMIYDGGTPLLWWLAIVAMAFAVWQAFKRRSLGLTLIAVAFFWQWLSWGRIDRAAFQYHFYTALPFFLMGLAYFLSELWHGPSRRTWLLARVGLAAATVFVPVLWLAKYQLCGLARVATDDYWGKLTCGTTAGPLAIDTHVFAIGVVLIAALAWLAIALYRLERNPPEPGDESWGWVVQLVVPVVAAGALLLWIGQNVPSNPFINIQMPSDWVALLLLVLLGALAVVVLLMRSPRKYVLAVCGVAAVLFTILYPNLSAMPMPANVYQAYNGFLPTWFYGFQFSVNMQPAAKVSLVSMETVAMAGAVLFVALAASSMAWIRRVIKGYRRHQLVVAGNGSDSGAGSAGPGAGE